MTAKELQDRLAKAHWHWGFEHFCYILDLRQDAYAEELWTAFQELTRSIHRFDPNTLQRILDAAILDGDCC